MHASADPVAGARRKGFRLSKGAATGRLRQALVTAGWRAADQHAMPILAPLSGGCRFITAPDYLKRIAAQDLGIYCGEKRIERSSYCEEHHWRCYVRPEKREAAR